MSEPISFPMGVHMAIPFATYRGAEGMNISKLKEICKSPRQYEYRLDHPKDSAALTKGRAAHTATLEPVRFFGEYALWDERTDSGTVRPRRGKDWDAFAATNADKTIIRADEYNTALAIRDAVRAHPAAAKYLRRGDAEVSMFWQNAFDPRLCKGRLDFLTYVDGIDTLVGLKTTRDASPIAFGNQAARLGYHLQWAYYLDGYRAIARKQARVVEIVVESAAPHDVAVYIIPSEVLEKGQEEYRIALEKLTECEAKKSWPGVADVEQMLSLPSWIYKGDDDLSELGLEVA